MPEAPTAPYDVAPAFQPLPLWPLAQDTLDYRVQAHGDDGEVLSLWHDVPLTSEVSSAWRNCRLSTSPALSESSETLKKRVLSRDELPLVCTPPR